MGDCQETLANFPRALGPGADIASSSCESAPDVVVTDCTLFSQPVATVSVVIRSSWSGGLILSVYNGLTEIVRVGAEPDGVILLIENHMADCASPTLSVYARIKPHEFML